MRQRTHPFDNCANEHYLSGLLNSIHILFCHRYVLYLTFTLFITEMLASSLNNRGLLVSVLTIINEGSGGSYFTFKSVSFKALTLVRNYIGITSDQRFSIGVRGTTH